MMVPVACAAPSSVAAPAGPGAAAVPVTTAMLPPVPQVPPQLGPVISGTVAVPPGVQIPQAPVLRELADPETVNTQKESYARDLETQLRKGVEVLGVTHKQQTEALHAAANQEKTRYNLAMDQQVKQQELFLSQEYNEQLMRLQQAAQAKRAELEQQATQLTLEFQQRKVQEEFMAQQLGIQQQHQEAQRRLEEEMRKLGLQPGQAVPGFGAPGPHFPTQASAVTTVAPTVSYAAPPMAPAAAAAVNGVVPYAPPPTTAAPLPTAVSTQPPTFGNSTRCVATASTFFGVPHSPMSIVVPCASGATLPGAVTMAAYPAPPPMRSSRPSITGGAAGYSPPPTPGGASVSSVSAGVAGSPVQERVRSRA